MENGKIRPFAIFYNVTRSGVELSFLSSRVCVHHIVRRRVALRLNGIDVYCIILVLGRLRRLWALNALH